MALSSTYSQPRIMKKLEESNLQLHLEKLKVDPSVDVSKGNTSVSRKYFRHTSSTIVNWTNWLLAVVCFNHKTPIMSQL